MQTLTSILLLISLQRTIYSAEIVYTITDDNFTSFLISHEYSFIMFNAPWCHHCKKAFPEFTEAAEQLIDFSPPVGFAKVDCTAKGKLICKMQGIVGFPTMKLFKRSKVIKKYDGVHIANNIARYIWIELGPVSIELACMEELTNFMKARNKVHIVGFFEKESPLKLSYLKHPKTLWKNAKFGHIDSKKLQHPHCRNCVVLFRPTHLNNKFEENYVEYNGNGSDLGHFILTNYHGLVGHRRPDNKIDFAFPLIVAYYNVDYKNNFKSTNYWRNRIMLVAKNFVDKMYFAISTSEEFLNELDEINVVDVNFEKPIIIGRDNDETKFLMEAEFTVENLEEFVTNMIDNKLNAYVKSQAVPQNNTGPVFVAVSKNFQEMIMDNGKDTFLEFYAPWCGQCNKVAPIYEELGKKLADEDVMLVKMDATANEVPVKFRVRGYPTFYWLSKDSKDDPIEYVGGPTLEDFIEYIAKYAENELKGYDRDGSMKTSTKN